LAMILPIGKIIANSISTFIIKIKN